MQADGALDFLPLWALFLVTAGLVLASVEIGHRLGAFRRRRQSEEKEAPVGAMVGATLGLLGFFLAFTFGMGATRFDNRRQIIVEEANAIGTCYLRAGTLPPAESLEMRSLLRRYTASRLDAVDPSKRAEAVKQGEELHAQMWKRTEVLARNSATSIIVGLFIQSLNDVIDVHSKRLLVSLRSRIPATIWGVLYLVTVLSMLALGYHAGLSGTTRSPSVVVLVLTFAAIMLLIADLDRPQEGLLEVSQEPMEQLQKSMDEP